MFKYTTKGCAKALKYLKDTKQEHLIEREASTDGWTIVSLANSLKKKGT